MSRFGLLARRAPTQDKRKLECIGKTYIDNHSFVIYKGKLEGVFLWCLTNGRWYRLKYKPYNEEEK